MEKQSDIVTEYRKKHPRCRYCKYLEMNQYPVMWTYGWDAICTLKDKMLYDSTSLLGEYVRGMFCKNFEPRHETKER